MTTSTNSKAGTAVDQGKVTAQAKKANPAKAQEKTKAQKAPQMTASATVPPLELQKAFGVDEIKAAIEQERQELTAEQQKHLFSHIKTNAANQLNHELYCTVKSYKRVEITLCNLRADSKAFINLRGDQKAIWSEGDESNRLVGLSLSTSKDPVLYVSNFLVNVRELFVQTYNVCNEIKLQLYVLTEQSFVKGRVDLPPGASVTFQSLNDRTTLIGLSSFAIDLD